MSRREPRKRRRPSDTQLGGLLAPWAGSAAPPLHGVHVLGIVSTAIDEQSEPSKPWPVEMRVIVFLEPIVAQAENLTSQVAADMRVVGPPIWASTPGWLKGIDEPGAITIFCTVLADDASDAKSVADDVFELAIQSLIDREPPGLLLPVLTDPRVPRR